ncbi:unnamed protein product [Lasius platythorax]|uniref:Uncharacterized protein n=1 Tax=Lasius platythorax TaxID=488582 RepID=A0AAV2NC75_9HYME
MIGQIGEKIPSAEISIRLANATEASPSPQEILLLEAGELLWAWSMNGLLTQIPRLSTFWAIAINVNNERTCRQACFNGTGP